VDGKRFFKGKVSCVLTANAGKIPGGVEAFPQAHPDDGRLELGVVTARDPVQWARTFGRLALGHPEQSPFARDALTEQLKNVIGDPKLVALILAKSALADERAVQLRIADDCCVTGQIADISEVLTVTGNLIDNAIEATAQVTGERWVELTIVSAGSDLLVRVRDTGPGVPEESREEIFTDGFTSKSSPAGARRGLGLALVRQITQRRGGMISVGRDGGAVFTATLPRCIVADEASMSADPAAALGILSQARPGSSRASAGSRGASGPAPSASACAQEAGSEKGTQELVRS
jgi:hypothetical protein